MEFQACVPRLMAEAALPIMVATPAVVAMTVRLPVGEGAWNITIRGEWYTPADEQGRPLDGEPFRLYFWDAEEVVDDDDGLPDDVHCRQPSETPEGALGDALAHLGKHGTEGTD